MVVFLTSLLASLILLSSVYVKIRIMCMYIDSTMTEDDFRDLNGSVPEKSS